MNFKTFYQTVKHETLGVLTIVKSMSGKVIAKDRFQNYYLFTILNVNNSKDPITWVPFRKWTEVTEKFFLLEDTEGRLVFFGPQTLELFIIFEPGKEIVECFAVENTLFLVEESSSIKVGYIYNTISTKLFESTQGETLFQFYQNEQHQVFVAPVKNPNRFYRLNTKICKKQN